MAGLGHLSGGGSDKEVGGAFWEVGDDEAKFSSGAGGGDSPFAFLSGGCW
jgi:hypothetical protein